MKVREKHQSWYALQLGTEPRTQAFALTGNETHFPFGLQENASTSWATPARAVLCECWCTLVNTHTHAHSRFLCPVSY